MVHRVVERYRELMKVYLLANMLLDHKTANLVVDETFRTLNILGMAPGIRAVALLYDNTIPGDGMRNLWADWYAHNVSILSFPDPEDEGVIARPWPYDFLADVLKGVQEHKKLQWQLTGKRLVYRMDQYFLTATTPDREPRVRSLWNRMRKTATMSRRPRVRRS